MTAITITLAGVPVAKGRPRSTRTGHSYTPAKTRSYEGMLRYAAQQEMRGHELFDEAVSVDLLVQLPIARSWPKKRQAAALTGDVQPTGKPDLDNVCKAATDALNGVVYRDDSQIVSMTATKRYGDPLLVVTVRPAGHLPVVR